jgi:hypothetical protein
MEEPCEGVGGQKVIGLDFQTVFGRKRISILDEEQAVALAGGGGWTLKIQEIFAHFKEKPGKPSDLEVLDGAICNWHAYYLGPYNPKENKYDTVDVSGDKWWEKLPLFEEITQEQVFKRYNKESIEEVHVAVLSKRKTVSSDIEERHSYFEIVYPRGNGMYAVVPIGHYPLTYPETTIAKLKYIAATVESRFIYPDLNTFVPRRQAVIFDPTADPEYDQAALLQLLGQYVLDGLNGHLPFQFIAGNCSSSTQELLSKAGHTENLFGMKVDEAYPTNPVMKFIFTLIRILPSPLKGWLIRFIVWVLGGNKGLVINKNGKNEHVRVASPSLIQQGTLNIHNPSKLFNSVEDPKKPHISGRTTFGFALWA